MPNSPAHTTSLPPPPSPLQPSRLRRISISPNNDPENPPVEDDDVHVPVPPSLISPAFTPPSSPGFDHNAVPRSGRSFSLESPKPTTSKEPKLLETLPVVECIVRARIPTTTGQEMFLHLYQNSIDNKEHLAIVFGPHIRSRSLDAERPGETEKDRMIRGAYTGRLYPGRMSSRNETPAIKNSLPSDNDLQYSESTWNLLEGASKTLNHLELRRDSLSSSDLSTGYFAAAPSDPPLVRIHSECYTGETVWSARCDCGEQLDEAARLMSSLPKIDAGGTPSNSATPGGVIIYLRQEGRGIGLSEKLKAYNLQDLGADTVEANLLLRHPADARSYGLATAMLVDLGLGGDRGIKLLTNNPDKVRAVEGPNREVRVKERVGMVPLAWTTEGKQGIKSDEVGAYLRTKIEKMGHQIHS